MFSSKACAASPCRRPTWPMPPAPPSAASSSRSARLSPSACAASSSLWRPAVLTRPSLPPRLARSPPPSTPAEPRAPRRQRRCCSRRLRPARLHPHSARRHTQDTLSASFPSKPPTASGSISPKMLPAANRRPTKRQCEISRLEDFIHHPAGRAPADGGWSRTGEILNFRLMSGSKKDIDPTTALVEEDDEQSLPEVEREATIDLAAAAGPLAAGRAAIVRDGKLAPNAPGVYRMIDANGEVLYVGKAKSIKKRIASYARPTGYEPRIERMIAATAALEFVSTATETEALLLEANLIKR